MSAVTRRIVLDGVRSVRVEELAADTEPVGSHEVVVATHYSLISPGTELAYYRGRDNDAFLSGAQSLYPIHPGYAAAATVMAAGGESGFREGQRVLSHTEHQSRQRFDVRRRLCLAVPDDVPDRQVPFCRLAQVGGVSLRAAKVDPGELVVVIGLGPVGNLVAQLAQAAGADVVGVEPLEARRKLAEQCGLGHVVEPAAATDAVTGRGGGRLVLECSGRGSAAVLATDLAARGGQVVTVGAPWRSDAEVPVSAFVAGIFKNYLTVRSGWEWQFPLYDSDDGNSLAACSRWVLDCLATGSLVVDPLITDVVEPGDAARAYQQLDEAPGQHFGTLFDWS